MSFLSKIFGYDPDDEKPGAKATLELLKTCGDLGEPSDITEMGLIVSIPLKEGEIVRKQIRTLLLDGNWESATKHTNSKAGFDEDLIQWFVLSRTNQSDVIIEIVFYVELYYDDEVQVLKYISQDEKESLRNYVHDWTPLQP